MVASDHPTLVFPSTQLAMKRVSSLRDRELWRWLHEHEHTWGRFSPTSRLAARKRQRCQTKRLLKVLLCV